MNNLYDYIINPKTGKKCKVKGVIGNKIIKQYLNLLKNKKGGNYNNPSENVGGDHHDNKNKMYCAPGKDTGTSCFSLESLKKIGKTWNSKNNDKIKIVNNKKVLWNNINKIFKKNTKCKSGNDKCWLSLENVEKLNNNEINENTFRPKMPDDWKNDKTSWLSTTDIANVLNQYKNTHKDLEIIGPVPLDFDTKLVNNSTMQLCVADELCKMNIKKLLKKGIRKIAIIFNLDKHNEPGSHWVSMFVDLNEGCNYFFDSFGHKPVNEIQILMNRIKEQVDELIKKNEYKIKNSEFKNIVNSTEYQEDGHSCGLYSIDFMVRFIEGGSYKKIKNDKNITDKLMDFNKFNKYFNI